MTILRAPNNVKVTRVLRRDGDVVYKGQVLFYSAPVDGTSDVLGESAEMGTPVKASCSGTLKYHQTMRSGIELEAGDRVLSILTDAEAEDDRMGVLGPEQGPEGPEDAATEPAGNTREAPAPLPDDQQIVWGAPIEIERQPAAERWKEKRRHTRKPHTRKTQSTPPRPAVRFIGSCLMLGGSVLFFWLAWYQYDYLGKLIAMADSTTPGADLEQISAVHGFYSKTFVVNVSLGAVAVLAGLAWATNRLRLATFAVGLWAVALAVSQGLTMYTMSAGNILLETYIKGGLLFGAVLMLYVQRMTTRRRRTG